MDGGAASSDLDQAVGVTARRLGGNLMTTYNWVNNADNAGKDYRHNNGAQLAHALGIPTKERARPAVVIETMHETSLSLGAVSLVTVPLAGYVAADMNGPVREQEAAPSSRFVPLRWEPGTGAADPIDPSVCDVPQLLARLKARFGGAESGQGIWAYALDNEPGIWYQTHPRVVRSPATIQSLIEKSILAARIIKSIDPSVLIFGPVSWGATEMAQFQHAPDWKSYAHFGSFLAAYLDAFREASESAGLRLLDVLDVHWYPYSRRGELYRTEDSRLSAVLLNAPRTLTEGQFIEDSWVAEALPRGKRNGVTLPLLPNLTRLIERWFPGTHLSVSEFNYGGAGQLASGLAIADVLGRFAQSGVFFASHWGSLAGFIGEAYRLFRLPDRAGDPFGGHALAIEELASPDVAAYAARPSSSGPFTHVVVINKAASPRSIELVFESGTSRSVVEVLGFDADNFRTASLAESIQATGNVLSIRLPGRAARRYVLH